MRLGVHMPQKGGFQKNVKKAAESGMECLQVFPGNPTSWKLPRLDEEELGKRSSYLKEMEIYPLVIHSVYLVNLASPKPDVFEKSRDMIKQTMQRAYLYGAPYVVVHTGSHSSSGREKGISRVAEALEEQINEWPDGVTLLLENTCGGGSLLGGGFRDIGEILNRFPGAPLGMCLDTAHAWGAGYDLSDQPGVEQTLDELYRHLDPSLLKVIHVNDTPVELGSGKDRHQHIGEGNIGEKGFASLLQQKWPVEFPFILETPETGTEKDKENLEVLKKLRDR